MFKRISKMNSGDRFWFETSSFESVSAQYIGEFPEGHAFRVDGEINAQHTDDRLFELVG